MISHDANGQLSLAGRADPLTRTYDVQPGTGWVVSRERNGQWVRGEVYRGLMPAVIMPPRRVVFDPTRIETYYGTVYEGALGP